MKKAVTKKDTFYARLAFWLSLTFWIPLFNVGLSIVAVILAFKALKLADNSPKTHGGRKYAIVALIIGFAGLIASVVFLFVYTFRQVTCDVAPTLF